MLEMLKERKAALEAQGKKGFTLMEMLIVIAIIAILIAIAIPVFTAQMNSAKDATNEANARSLYAAMMADYMSGNTISTAPAVTDHKVTYGSTTYKFEEKDPVITLGSDGAPKIVIDKFAGGSVSFPEAAS